MTSLEARLAAEAEPYQYVEIDTRLGAIVIRLSNLTPKHRDNFKKLIEESVLDGTTFHRIIQGFMIQGGDPWSKDDDPMNDGLGDPGYTVPAEFDTTLFHTYGAVAAARQPDPINRQRESSGSQFYMVQGRPFGPGFIAEREQYIASRYPGFKYPAEVKAIYLSRGGAPQLDLDYTVFGHVVAGFDVIEAIAAVPTPRKRGEQGRLKDQADTPVVMSVKQLLDYSAPTEAKYPLAPVLQVPNAEGN